MTPSKHARWIAVAAAVVLLTSGCALTKQSKDIDPPPAGIDTTVGATNTSAQATSASIKAQTTLYFKDAKGFVAPLTMSVPAADMAVAKHSLEFMVDGGAEQSALPAGFTGLLPKGTQVKDININSKEKLVTINFSKEFKNYDPKDERKIMEAITWTMTGFPSVEKVQLQVEGRALKEMPVAKTPLDEPMTRAMGINLEFEQGVNIGQTTPVTLYFPVQSSDKFEYYVPVTRMITRTDTAKLEQAAMEQLIKGPLAQDGLSAVLDAAAQAKVTVGQDQTVSVDFNDKFLGDGKKASDEAVQSVILSLTENGASKVQITVDGSAKWTTAGDNKSYSKAVTRPEHLNPLKS